jgi:hypothetical protein
VFAVPAILDLTVAFDPNFAEPTLLNIIQGKKCRAEMFARYTIFCGVISKLFCIFAALAYKTLFGAAVSISTVGFGVVFGLSSFVL